MVPQMRKGVLLGALTALLFCAWVTVVRLTNGEGAFTRLGITYVGAVSTYLLMGVASGALIGSLIRFTDTRIGAYLVGFAGSAPIVAGIMLQTAGSPRRWTPEDYSLAPVLSLIITIVIGSEIQRRKKRTLTIE